MVFPNGRVNACGARAKRERERKPFFGERDAQSVCLPLLLHPFCRLGTIRNTCSFSGGGLWAGVGCGVYVRSGSGCVLSLFSKGEALLSPPLPPSGIEALLCAMTESEGGGGKEEVWPCYVVIISAGLPETKGVMAAMEAPLMRTIDKQQRRKRCWEFVPSSVENRDPPLPQDKE